jgi:hypothetical protein
LLQLKRQLNTLEKKTSETITQYVSRARSIANQIRATTGQDVSAADMALAVLGGLPSEYSMVKTVIENSSCQLLMVTQHTTPGLTKLGVQTGKLGKAGSRVEVLPTRPATTVTKKDTSSGIAASAWQMKGMAGAVAAGKMPHVVTLASWLSATAAPVSIQLTGYWTQQQHDTSQATRTS